MGDKTLVFKESSLENIATAITTATAGIRTEVSDTLDAVDIKLAGWGEGTLSKLAAVAYRNRLRDGIDNLLTKLDDVASALDDVAELAHECEVDNVAIVD